MEEMAEGKKETKNGVCSSTDDHDEQGLYVLLSGSALDEKPARSRTEQKSLCSAASSQVNIKPER